MQRYLKFILKNNEISINVCNLDGSDMIDDLSISLAPRWHVLLP